MAGTILAVGLVACAATFSGGLALAASAAVFGQRLDGAADAAALAAADAASGAVSGIPCDLAATIAGAADAELSRCDVAGLTATVAVSARFGPLTATASARAGPPP